MVRSLKEIVNDPPDDPSTLCPGLLTGSIGGVVAPGGTGKSLFSIQLGLSVASEVSFDPFMDDRNILTSDTSGPVTVLMAEDSDVMIENRIVPMMEEYHRLHGDNVLDWTDENFSVQSLEGSIPHILDSEGSNKEGRFYQSFREVCEVSHLVIIDPLRRFHGMDENSNTEMVGLIQRLEKITHETGTTVLFTHHVSQASMMNQDGGKQFASRGSTALVDSVRFMLNLSPMSPDQAEDLGIDEDERSRYVELHWSKLNYHKPIPSQWLKRLKGGVLTWCEPEIEGDESNEKF